MSEQKQTHEPGYKAVLLREETKHRLQEFRRMLPDRDLNQERRLATAAVDMLLAKPELHDEWLRLVRSVVERDLDLRAKAVS